MKRCLDSWYCRHEATEIPHCLNLWYCHHEATAISFATFKRFKSNQSPCLWQWGADAASISRVYCLIIICGILILCRTIRPRVSFVANDFSRKVESVFNEGCKISLLAHVRRQDCNLHMKPNRSGWSQYSARDPFDQGWKMQVWNLQCFVCEPRISYPATRNNPSICEYTV